MAVQELVCFAHSYPGWYHQRITAHAEPFWTQLKHQCASTATYCIQLDRRKLDVSTEAAPNMHYSNSKLATPVCPYMWHAHRIFFTANKDIG